MANEAEQAIYTRLASAPTFHPVTADLFVNDWGLDAGDVVTVRSGETDYSVPIYNMSLDWRGSAMAQIQSTGNKERKPLSALKRKEFRSGRSGYTTQKEIDHYETDFIRDRKNIGMFARAIGVQLDENGDPIIDPETGDYVWDDENGAEIYSRLVLSPNRAELVSAINDGTGTQISGAKIDLSAQGTVLIQAINNRPGSQSSVKIEADKIVLTGLVTASQLDARLANVDRLFTASGFAGQISADTVNAGYVYASGYGIGEDMYTMKSINIGGQGVAVLGTSNGTGINIPDVVTDFSISGNTLTLYRSDGTSENFSKATSLSGRWSGRNYIVTATPQGEINTGIVYDGLVPTGQVTKSGQYVYQDFIVYSDDGEGDADKIIMQKSVGINASSVYEDGQKSVTLSVDGWNWDSGNEYLYTKVDASSPNTRSATIGMPTTIVADSGSWDNQNRIVVAPYSYDKNGSLHIVGTNRYISANDVYNRGWSAAESKVVWPSAGTSAGFLIKVPSSTVGSDTSKSFTLDQSGNTVYAYMGGITVATLPVSGGGGSYADGWNDLVEAADTSSYVQYSGASSVSSSLSKSNGTIDGYIWLKDYSGAWQRRRHLTVSYPNDTYNKSVTLTYRGSVDGVYTYTTSTYVSGLSTGSRYTVHFNA